MNSDFNTDGSSDMFVLQTGVYLCSILMVDISKRIPQIYRNCMVRYQSKRYKDDNDTKMKDVVLLCFDKQKKFHKIH